MHTSGVVIGGVAGAAVGVLGSIGECIWHLLNWGWSSLRGDTTSAAVRLYAARDAITPSSFIDDTAYYTISQVFNSMVALIVPTLPAGRS